MKLGLNETEETLNQFYSKIHRATIEGQEWIETSKEIIDHFNKGGLGPHAEYFIFQSVKVTEFGKSQRLKEELERPLGQILYGDDEAKVIQGTNTAKVPSKNNGRR